jgi:hypothetical protein
MIMMVSLQVQAQVQAKATVIHWHRQRITPGPMTAELLVQITH